MKIELNRYVSLDQELFGVQGKLQRELNESLETQRRLNEKVHELERKNETLQTTIYELRENVSSYAFQKINLIFIRSR